MQHIGAGRTSLISFTSILWGGLGAILLLGEACWWEVLFLGKQIKNEGVCKEKGMLKESRLRYLTEHREHHAATNWDLLHHGSASRTPFRA